MRENKKIYTAPQAQCHLLSSADVIQTSVIGLEEIDLQAYMGYEEAPQ